MFRHSHGRLHEGMEVMRVFAYSRRERAFLISVASLVLLLSSIGVVAPLRAPMATWVGGAVASAAAAEAAPTAEPGANAP